jgi:hypothetical protein
VRPPKFPSFSKAAALLYAFDAAAEGLLEVGYHTETATWRLYIRLQHVQPELLVGIGYHSETLALQPNKPKTGMFSK